MSDRIKTEPDHITKPGPTPAEERRARQAEALRENLRRRKQQAREVAETDSGRPEKPR